MSYQGQSLGVWTLCRDAVGVYYIPSHLGYSHNDRARRCMCLYVQFYPLVNTPSVVNFFLVKNTRILLFGGKLERIPFFLSSHWRQHPTILLILLVLDRNTWNHLTAKKWALTTRWKIKLPIIYSLTTRTYKKWYGIKWAIRVYMPLRTN